MRFVVYIPVLVVLTLGAGVVLHWYSTAQRNQAIRIVSESLRRGDCVDALKKLKKFDLSSAPAGRQQVGTWLHQCVRHKGCAPVLSYLADHGADVNWSDSESRHSALHLAALSSNLEAIRALREKGATLDLRDNFGSTPLMWAAEYSEPDVVDYLIRCGAATQLRNRREETAAMIAERRGDGRVIILFRNLEIRASGTEAGVTRHSR